MSYAKKIDRSNPACIIFLLDQSASMDDHLSDGSGLTKAEGLANAINELLRTIVRRCVKEKDAAPRHYYDIGVIGYGKRVRPLFGGSLAGRPLASVGEIGNAILHMKEYDGVSRPVWFEPVANGLTPMCEAFDIAGQAAAGWMQSHPNSFPAIVINITDGIATSREQHGDSCQHEGSCDPTVWAGRIRGLANSDGNVLLFTINMSANSQGPISFPSSEASLPDDYARLLFRMSSELPGFMRDRAAELGVPTAPDARGFVCNADMSTVIRALEVGTSLDRLEV